MARLLRWPNGLRPDFREPLSGPRTLKSGETESTQNFTQTFSSPFGLWKWRLTFPGNIRGQMFRRYRGLVTALHGGANAVRVKFCDWDAMSLADRGVNMTRREWLDGQRWSNGMTWSNGKNWDPSTSPVVRVIASAPQGGTIITLGTEYFGSKLDKGDWLGFFPFHFGLYTITGKLGPTQYRIWPPLRKDLFFPRDYATLHPTMAMKLESEEGGTSARGSSSAENLALTMVEVPDYYVREYFTEDAE